MVEEYKEQDKDDTACYVVAVSGGVDSVVLLDMLASQKSYKIIVAHFDHGIRKDSAADARFVQALAAKYDLPFVMRREELGANASEELARTRRYDFLRGEAKKYTAEVVTAHHLDDVIETICINLTRGTGWRGLAVFGNVGIKRPLLSFTKNDLRRYALVRRLEWVEDATNAEDRYLRNRLRRRLATGFLAEEKELLLQLWHSQKATKNVIDTEAARFIHPTGEYSRYFFTVIDVSSATELLRAVIVARMRLGPTRPQIERALIAIKTARPGSSFELGSGVTLLFGMRTFIVETP